MRVQGVMVIYKVKKYLIGRRIFFSLNCWRKRIASNNQENRTRRRNSGLLEHTVFSFIGKVVNKDLPKEGCLLLSCMFFGSRCSFPVAVFMSCSMFSVCLPCPCISLSLHPKEEYKRLIDLDIISCFKNVTF